MIFNAEKNYLFVHIQKNAGSSITKLLLDQEGSHFVSPAHLLLRQVEFTYSQRPFTFAVVRNPWERLASWWAMMQRRGVHNTFSRYLLSNQSNGTPVNFSTFIRRIAVEEAEDRMSGHVAFPQIPGLRYVGVRLTAISRIQPIGLPNGPVVSHSVRRDTSPWLPWRGMADTCPAATS